MAVVTQIPLSAQLAGGGNAKADVKDGAKGGKGGAKGKAGPPPEPAKRITTVEINQPDFGGPGVWSVPYITNMGDPTRISDGGLPADQCLNTTSEANAPVTSCAPFTAKGKEYFTKRRQFDSATDPEGFCLPPGVPRMMYTPYPMKIIQEPKWITFIYEGGAHVWRNIPLVANAAAVKHSDDPNPTYLGESVGYFEGDTLVIDTIGFNDRTWLDFAGHPHGEKLRVVERYTRLNMVQLEHKATIYDDEFYTQPWTVRITTNYQPTNQLMEYICQENEADTKHLLDNLRKRGIDPEKIP